jgi:hypothetical protein
MRGSAVDPVHVGVDLALVGLERGGEGHTRRIGSAAPECGDVVVVVDALETRDDHHVAVVQGLAHVALLDRQDPRLAERVVREDRHLPARVALCLHSQLVQRDRQQADGDLLARGGDHVQLPRGGVGIELPGEAQQAVGLARHGGGHDHQFVALVHEARHAPRDLANAPGLPMEVPPYFWTISDTGMNREKPLFYRGAIPRNA